MVRDPCVSWTRLVHGEPLRSPPLVSVIVPVLRDVDQLTLLLEALGEGPLFEVIVANGEEAEEDASLSLLAEQHPTVRWSHGRPGRATQMNAGARLAHGRWLLFVHADTRLGAEWLEEMRRVDRESGGSVGGAFAFRLRHSGTMARVIDNGVALRVRWCGLPYGDQGIFVRRDVFEALGGYTQLPIMEDVDLVRRLRREGPMVWSHVPIEVSARRWKRDGWLRRSVLNVSLVGLFYCGVSPGWLARRYYGRTEAPVAAPVAGSRPDVGPLTAGTGRDIVVIIPALNEQDAITAVLDEIPDSVQSVTVVDNGSTDETADRAASRGARVVREPRRGYGRACSAGLRANPNAEVIVFLDADRSDYPGEIPTILAPILSGEADLVMGYRSGAGRSVTARLGTWLCVTLINQLWGTSYRDLGPFRAIRRETIDRLGMVDQTWGWTIEMQVKAAEAALRVVEVPVEQRPRIGRSKISGTVIGTLRAGTRMLATIASLRWTRRNRSYS